jgi:hypothetical protein
MFVAEIYEIYWKNKGTSAVAKAEHNKLHATIC